MNKISKKILAIVTMAAFVVTMMPFAAFAASNKEADVQTSAFNVVDKSGNVLAEANVDVDDPVTAEFVVNDNEGYGTTAPLSKDAASKIKIWAVDNKTNQVTSALEIADETYSKCDANKNVYKVAQDTTEIINEMKVQLSFSRTGDYTVYAGVGDFGTNGDVSTIEKLDGASVVHVDESNVTTDYITIKDHDGNDLKNKDGKTQLVDGDTVTIKLDADEIIENGIDDLDISATAYQNLGELDQYDDDLAAIGETFNITTNRDEITVDPAEVTSDNMGEFAFNYSITKAGNYKIYISNEDIEVTVNINDADTELDNIETTVDNAQTMLAGSDVRNYKPGNIPTDYSDAIQFEITDRNGDVVEADVDAEGDVTNDKLNGEPAAYDDPMPEDHDKYLSIEDKPEDSDLEAADLALVWNTAKEAYTIKYVGKDAADDLIPGEYTVKISLLSGKTATATFTLANYGTTQDLVLDVTGNGVELNDEVLLGSKIAATAKYVDENGIEIAAGNDVQYGYKGSAVRVVGPSVDPGLDENEAQLYANDIINETFIGTIVTVQAFDADVQKYVEKELTVVSSYGAFGLAFDSENGVANDENEVNVTIVDEDGDVQRVNGDVYAYVADQTNENAKVEVDTVKNVKNGKGVISIFSNEETSVDVVVAVKAANGTIYADTLTYTIGEEDVNADTTVVMTIGSSDIVVNNEVVTGDAAPFVDSNWRTMVPVRALSQSFGGSAEWDGDARTVTVENGDTTIVFTADSDKYTVNGEEKTMDTALTIVEGRTYVPVKFVAEELGYTVTALKDAQGLTASVVIQK